MIALSRLDYSHLRRLKTPIYAALILSILAVLGAGHASNGAQRAINFPFFSFQASELGKVLLILALAALLVDRARSLRDRDTTARVMVAALIPAMFVIAQPDLGSGLVYMVIAAHAAVRGRGAVAAPGDAGGDRGAVGHLHPGGRPGRRACTCSSPTRWTA